LEQNNGILSSPSKKSLTAIKPDQGDKEVSPPLVSAIKSAENRKSVSSFSSSSSSSSSSTPSLDEDYSLCYSLRSAALLKIPVDIFVFFPKLIPGGTLITKLYSSVFYSSFPSLQQGKHSPFNLSKKSDYFLAPSFDGSFNTYIMAFLSPSSSVTTTLPHKVCCYSYCVIVLFMIIYHCHCYYYYCHYCYYSVTSNR
jgi:hypothetical protein